MKGWQQVNQYWEGLQPRERVALVVGAVALLFALIYFSIWQPLMSAREEMRQEVTQQRALLRWMSGAADEARQLRGSGTGTLQGGQSLLSLVDQSARKAEMGGVLKRVEPDGKQVRIWLDGASFDKMIAWLEALERDNGVHVVNATIERGGSTGVVNARLRLAGGGA